MFSDPPKNKNLLEDVKFLNHVKLCEIPFSCFREEVENVSANQMSRRQSTNLEVDIQYLIPVMFRKTSGLPIGPKNTNLDRDIQYLLPVMFRKTSGLSGEMSKMSRPIRGRAALFDRPEYRNLVEDIELYSCHVLPNSFQWFRRKIRKSEKLTTAGRTTDEGQCVITIMLRCTDKRTSLIKMHIHNTREPKQATKYNIGHSRTYSQSLDQVLG